MQLFSSWTGSDFLLFYSTLLAFATGAAWWIPAQLRHAGRRGESQDLESVALLAGGRERLAESLLADLYVRGGLAMADKGRLTVAQPRIETSPAGRTLLAAEAPISLGEAKRLVAIHAERAATRLRRSGLMLRAEEYTRLRWLSVTPFGALLMLGAYRQRAGSAVGEPTEFLIMLMILTLVLAVIRFASSDPRTASGIAAVRQMREQNSRFTRAPRPEEVGMAVALFGTGVLVGTPWELVHSLKQKDGDSSGGSDGDGDGGSGCGGCGGCGG